MDKYKDLSGQRFGRLFVIERAQNNRHRRSQWRCRCDCGNEVIVVGYSLSNGSTKSCGCYRSELVAEKNWLNSIHGGSGTRIYRTWANMLRRCNDPECDAYPHYGGRGIAVCDTWSNDFVAFKEWVLFGSNQKGAKFGRIKSSEKQEKSPDFTENQEICGTSIHNDSPANPHESRLLGQLANTFHYTEYL